MKDKGRRCRTTRGGHAAPSRFLPLTPLRLRLGGQGTQGTQGTLSVSSDLVRSLRPRSGSLLQKPMADGEKLEEKVPQAWVSVGFSGSSGLVLQRDERPCNATPCDERRKVNEFLFIYCNTMDGGGAERLVGGWVALTNQIQIHDSGFRIHS